MAPADPQSLRTETLPGPLTPRQREVAALIAHGLTNRQIAATLFIAERTADTHVAHILARLGLHSRAEVAAWAVERGLAVDVSPD
jgi:non-specific serine/threonine protein kinase